MATIKLPSLFSITGGIDPTHACFFSSESGAPESKIALDVKPRSLVGTKGSYSEIAKLTPDTTPDSNIQRVDGCFLPIEHEFLHVCGGLKFVNTIDSINSNNPEVIEKTKAYYASQAAQDSIDEIAKRTVVRFLNGSPLFRNARAINIKLIVNYDGDTFTHDVDHDLSFDDDLPNYAQSLANRISKALKGNIKDLLTLTYEYIVEVGAGQEVYPSEEFAEGEDGKILFRVQKEQAGLHTQKVGNALRTIDTWYEENTSHPIPVDPFGPDKKFGRLNRRSNNVFSHFEKMLSEKELTQHEHCYLTASIIRGGVYSGKGKNG
ncbi:type I-F CRISPR-associated protein Cas7f/Csy3 [Glaciecola siphonariae]|uniref:Type I-F CRISPR-associated protein Cas7f/Csy3 n=1 Tax=Glaciecola siphonariae TaxID=521012 RepID=A0ABV9LWP2_9ALTE